MLGFMTKNGKKTAEHDGVGVATPVVKVIELVGTSDKGFAEAIESAVGVASKSLRGISGADVKHMTVGIRDGKIEQYRVDLKIAFAIDEDED